MSALDILGVDTSELTIRDVKKLFLNLETHPRAEQFKSHIAIDNGRCLNLPKGSSYLIFKISSTRLSKIRQGCPRSDNQELEVTRSTRLSKIRLIVHY